jgi:hypothetical protein
MFNTALQKISNKQQKLEMFQHLPLQIEGFKGSENVETGSGCIVEPEPQGAENFGWSRSRNKAGSSSDKEMQISFLFTTRAVYIH